MEFATYSLLKIIVISVLSSNKLTCSCGPNPIPTELNGMTPIDFMKH